jgi:pimeloyl-ACP methyl ester carboxylesterase
MVARIARLLSVAWLVSVAALLAWGRRSGWHAGVWAGLYLLVLGHPSLLAVELAISRRICARGVGGTTRRVPAATLVRAWLREWQVSALVFGWRMPWRASAHPDHLPDRARGRRGVVFVHGFLCNRGVWNPWLAQLTREDRAFVAVDLEPVFAGIDAYAETIERAVRRVESATGLAPVIVAHSMGGLAVRAWLRLREDRDGSASAREAVAHAVTIGTPHRGTWMARISRAPNGRQMRLGSPWLAALEAAEAAGQGARYSCWWSDCDQIVFPPPTAVLPGSRACLVQGAGHLSLAEREEIRDELRRLLER